MADDNQQPENNEPLENKQWEEKKWQEKMDYAKEVLARQQAETDRSKKESEQPEGSEASQNLDSTLDATNKKLDEDEEAEWAEKLAMAKNGDRGDGNEEKSPEDIQKLLKKVAPIDKKIRDEMKKTGKEYFIIYLNILVLGGLFDVIGVICDLVGIAFWVNLIISPIYFAFHWVLLNYANMGISSKELEDARLQNTLIAAAIATTGIPTRIATMLREFRIRRDIGDKATGEIVKLQGDRQKILGRSLSLQYPPPNLKFKN